VADVKGCALAPARNDSRSEGPLWHPLLLKSATIARLRKRLWSGLLCRWTIAARNTLEGLSVKEEEVSGGSGTGVTVRGRSRHATVSSRNAGPSFGTQYDVG